MNILRALWLLELNGGHIYRETAPVAIYRWKDQTWADMEGCRVTLNIGDLTAVDWRHSMVVK